MTVGIGGNQVLAATAVSTTSRAIAAAFQPSATKWTFITITFSLATTVANNTVAVTLFSDAANPPTTARAAVELTAAIIGQSQAQLTFLVPPAWFVLLTKTGTGTAAITQQTQVLMA